MWKLQLTFKKNNLMLMLTSEKTCMRHNKCLHWQDPRHNGMLTSWMTATNGNMNFFNDMALSILLMLMWCLGGIQMATFYDLQKACFLWHPKKNSWNHTKFLWFSVFLSLSIMMHFYGHPCWHGACRKKRTYYVLGPVTKMWVSYSGRRE